MYSCHITCIGVFCSYHNVISLKRILIFPRLLYIQLEHTKETESNNLLSPGTNLISMRSYR